MPRDDAVEHQKDQQEKLKDEEDEERGNERVTRGRRRRRRLAWARDLEQSSGLLSLPREVLLQILGRLSFRDLLAVRQASAYFEEVSRDPTLWREYEVRRRLIVPYTVVAREIFVSLHEAVLYSACRFTILFF